MPISAVSLGSGLLLLLQQGKLLLGSLALLLGLAEGQRRLGTEGWQEMFIPHPRQSHAAAIPAKGNKETRRRKSKPSVQPVMETSRTVPQTGWRRSCWNGREVEERSGVATVLGPACGTQSTAGKANFIPSGMSIPGPR